MKSLRDKKQKRKKQVSRKAAAAKAAEGNNKDEDKAKKRKRKPSNKGTPAKKKTKVFPFKVGDTVEVHWPAEDSWYRGSIITVGKTATHHFQVHYEDDTKYWHHEDMDVRAI